jgi:hypothetical protein
LKKIEKIMFVDHPLIYHSKSKRWVFVDSKVGISPEKWKWNSKLENMRIKIYVNIFNIVSFHLPVKKTVTPPDIEILVWY